jgi:hypothetical protein
MEQLIEPNDGQSVADVLLCTFEVQLLCIVYFISCYRENFCKQSSYSAHHRVHIFTRDETGLVYLPTQLERTVQLYW